MANKRTYYFSIIGIILILSLFCSCGNKNNQKDFSVEIQENWNASISDNQPEFLNLLDEKSSFEYISTESLGDGYYVATVSVSSPDISESIAAYQEEVYGKKTSKEEINEKLCELINSADLKTTTQTIDIIVDEDGNVRTQFNDNFINAMFGYAYIDSIKTYMNEQDKEN